MVRDAEMINYSSKNRIEHFWKKALHKIGTDPLTYKETALPLARIKRLMKVEQEVNKVASEVPVMFAKLVEIFVEELTLRAWVHTEESKRRILQRGDICSAAKASDVFDFLIYLIPRTGAISMVEDHMGIPPQIKHEGFAEEPKLDYHGYSG